MMIIIIIITAVPSRQVMTKTVYALLISPMHAVVSAHLIFLFNLMTLVTNIREWEKFKIKKPLIL